MIWIYCRDQHRSGPSLCAPCASLVSYAMDRIDRCPFAGDKPTCADYWIHCYKVDQREAIRAVMRYAGPRMVWRHPCRAVLHLLDGRRGRIAQQHTKSVSTPQVKVAHSRSQP